MATTSASVHTLNNLLRDLHSLGVAPGDILFVHSSFKSLGPVAGGVETVIRALEDSISPDGLLLMPSFNLVSRESRAEVWNVATTASTVGWITEYFRRMSDTFRSDHYSHSVAARGPGAQDFVADHLSQEGYDSPWDLLPWGKTFGHGSPMVKAYRAGGKLLMLGVDYFTSTYIHLVEVLYWQRLRSTDPDVQFPALDRLALGEFWEQNGDVQHGSVGDAPCRLFNIQSYVDALLHEVTVNPRPYLRFNSAAD